MKALLIDRTDNVAVALEDIRKGDIVAVGHQDFPARQDIPCGHKIAVKQVLAGDYIVKYGVPIGRAKEDIPEGSFVHTHNVLDITSELCQEYSRIYRSKEMDVCVS